MSRCIGKPLAMALVAACLAAQTPPPADKQPAKEAPPRDEAEVVKLAVPLLFAFARSAESAKMPTRARDISQQILEHYDPEHAGARAMLGFKKVKGQWQQATPTDKLPADSPTPEQKKAVADAAARDVPRVGKLHRELGIRLLGAGEQERGRRQLERALALVPEDPDAHRAIGHEEVDGYFGTAEQVAFVRRMRTIRDKAREIAALEIAVEQVPADLVPQDLKATGYLFVGARSAHVTYWVAGTHAEAAKSAIWCERAILLLDFLLGDSKDALRQFNTRPVRWVGVLRSPDQRAHLIDVSPATRAGYPVDRALMFDGMLFDSASGRAEWTTHLPEVDADHAVAQITKRGTSNFNPGLSEGLVHTMTWLLCGTMMTCYMDLPRTRAERGERSRDPDAWLRTLRDQIDASKDWPLAEIPRERMDNFRNAVRMKSWSFVLWLLARHPDRWAALLAALGDEKLTVEQTTAILEKSLGRKLDDIEAEWRDWVRRDSAIGKASGLPQ